MSEDRAFVEGYCGGKGIRVEWEGEIGFGRECVGLVAGDRDVWIAYARGPRGEIGTGPPETVTDSYHKDDYIAVLGRGKRYERQLRLWVEHLIEVEATYEWMQKLIPDLGSLVYGHSDELVALPNDGGAAKAERERLRVGLAGLV